MANKKIIHIIISLIPLLFMLGYIFDLTSAEVAFPISFTFMGLQHLFYGLFISNENRSLRYFSVLIGSLSLLFSFFILMPKYYF